MIDKNCGKLILVRGVSGMGKTTFTRKLCEQKKGLVHIESDFLYYNAQGEYIFDKDKLGQNHATTLDCADYLLSGGFSVVVTNTFTQTWEIKRYVNGCTYSELQVLRLFGEPWGNNKGIPDTVIQRMQSKLQDWPDEVWVDNRTYGMCTSPERR